MSQKRPWRKDAITVLFVVLAGWIWISVACAGSLPAAPGVDEDRHTVQARLIADGKEIIPGEPFRLGVEFMLAPGWHIYYLEPGDTGRPTTVEWELPPGFTVGSLLWEKPSRFRELDLTAYGYQGQTLVAAEIVAPVELKQGDRVTVYAKVTWLACKESCIPGAADLTLTLTVGAPGSRPVLENAERFSGVGFIGKVEDLDQADEASGPGSSTSVLDRQIVVEDGSESRAGVLVYVLLAFAGGLILNLMPCVLPVISLKIMSFVKQAGDDRRTIFRHGLSYTAGTLFSFLVLAALVVVLKSAGHMVGWGFQFQSPVFLVFICALLQVLALSLFGLFYVSVSIGQNQLGNLAGRSGMVGSFFTGVLATILSTPCSAPFLGTALGFAFAQPWWMIFIIFLSIGTGLSLPYLVLTAKPGWLKLLPKPGAWMEHLKELMGFVLLATVVWLLWVVGRQIGLDGLIWVVGFLLIVALAAWLIARFAGLNTGRKRKVLVWTLASVMVAGGYYLMVSDRITRVESNVNESGVANERVAWEKFTVATLDQHLANGRTVFVDFTAEWCLTCKVNERLAVNTDAVAAKLQELNAVALKADWTSQDPEISKMLAKLGRSGVPVYVIFPASNPDKPILLPEIITQKMLLDALDIAGPSSP